MASPSGPENAMHEVGPRNPGLPVHSVLESGLNVAGGVGARNTSIILAQGRKELLIFGGGIIPLTHQPQYLGF